ncbi:MAG: hypothetical protein U0R79_01290 [Propionicimonas sp.]
MSGRWHAALGYALTGEELDLPEAQAPDPSGLVDDLAALGWTRTRIADHARRLLEAEQGWPHLVPASLRAGCGAARLAALMGSARELLDLTTLETRPPSGRWRLNADELPAAAGGPPHHGS